MNINQKNTFPLLKVGNKVELGWGLSHNRNIKYRTQGTIVSLKNVNGQVIEVTLDTGAKVGYGWGTTLRLI